MTGPSPFCANVKDEAQEKYNNTEYIYIYIFPRREAIITDGWI